MGKQNGGSRPQRDIYSDSRPQNGRRRADYDTEEFDRYNYVDRELYRGSRPQRDAYRDVYADSRPQSGAHYRKSAKKKKKSGAKRFFLALLSLILVVALGVIAYAFIMSSRLDRSDGGGTAGYVEQTSAAPALGAVPDKNVTNILLIGIDKNEEDGSDGRSDTNMLVSIDNGSKKIRLVSFLRDTYLEIPGHEKNKLNAAFAFKDGGPNLTLQTLQQNYQIPIGNYVSINSDNFEALIDKMGGLDIPYMNQAVCTAMNQNMGSRLKPGNNVHLNGKLALYYARIREIDSDFGRTGRQREVVELMVKKMQSLGPVQLSTVLYDYLPYVKTNLSNLDLGKLALNAKSIVNYPMETMHVPNDGTYTEKKVKGIGDVLVPDLPKNCELLREFLYGENSSEAPKTD